MPRKFALLGVKSARTLPCGGSFSWKILHHFNQMKDPDYEKCVNMLWMGQLVDIDFGDDDLLEYIADRSGLLELAWCCSDIYESWTKALEKLPLLEELNLYSAFFKEEFIAVIARCCPRLRTLKMNQEADRYWYGYDGEEGLNILNEIPIAIGEKLHDLRHLELIGMNISNIELKVILDGCCHLESLDLRQCLFVNLDGEFGKKCSEKINCLKLPNDSLEGCPYLYSHGVPHDFSTEPGDSDYNDSEDITSLHEFMTVHDRGLGVATFMTLFG